MPTTEIIGRRAQTHSSAAVDAASSVGWIVRRKPSPPDRYVQTLRRILALPMDTTGRHGNTPTEMK